MLYCSKTNKMHLSPCEIECRLISGTMLYRQLCISMGKSISVFSLLSLRWPNPPEPTPRPFSRIIMLSLNSFFVFNSDYGPREGEVRS